MPIITGCHDLEVGATVWVKVTLPDDYMRASASRTYKAVLDTGSKMSGITDKVIQDLHLGAGGLVDIATVTGARDSVFGYLIDLNLPSDESAMRGARKGKWELPKKLMAFKCDLSTMCSDKGVEVLLGRDIISQCALQMTPNRGFSFSY